MDSSIYLQRTLSEPNPLIDCHENMLPRSYLIKQLIVPVSRWIIYECAKSIWFFYTVQVAIFVKTLSLQICSGILIKKQTRSPINVHLPKRVSLKIKLWHNEGATWHSRDSDSGFCLIHIHVCERIIYIILYLSSLIPIVWFLRVSTVPFLETHIRQRELQRPSLSLRT